MRSLFKPHLLLCWLLLCALLVSPVRGQGDEGEPEEPSAERAFWLMTNAARKDNGVGLLAWSETLAAAAQQHADDISQREDPSHVGSDGSLVQQRAARVGYTPYPDNIRVSENWSTGSAMEAMAYFLEDQIHRDNMLLPIWREMGVGHAPTPWGGELWVVVYGAQPGVLPVFVNEDEPRTTERRVKVQIRQEEAGYSPDVFTTPSEMRVAEAEAIEDAPWQPWQAEVEVELSAKGGERELVVEFRDAQGQTVRSSDTIFLVLPTGPVPTARVQLAPTLTPTITPTVTPTPTLTPTPTATPIPTETPTPSPTPTPASALPLPPGTDNPQALLAFALIALLATFALGLLLGRVLSSRRV